MGVNEAQIDAFIAAHETDGDDEESDVFEYWPDTEQAVHTFWRVCRYIERIGIDGQPAGLKPEAVNMVLDKLNQGDDLQLFDDLMTIGEGQAAALRELIARG